MRSRREQIRAYRFVTRRIVSALLGGDPETADPPMRRAGLTTFASVMVGALVLAGFGVYGLVRPGGNTSWRNADTLIVEKETGTRYVYRGHRLHPVLNYASARLVLGAADPATVSVSERSLAGVPRGRPVGIPDAPDTLPAADSLDPLPWSVCTAGQSSAVSGKPRVTVAVHRTVAGGAGMADRGVLVHAAGEKPALLWHGHRFRIPDRTSMGSLGWTGERQVTVAPAFLNAIPAGPDLAPPPIDDRDAQGPPVAGAPAPVGTVYRMASASGTDQYFVLLSDGLATVSELTAELLVGAQDGVSPEALSPSDYDSARLSKQDLEVDGQPTSQPHLIDSDTAVDALCVAQGRHGSTGIRWYQSAPGELTGRATAAAGGTGEVGGPTADAVLVPGGGGALVRPTAAPGVPAGTTYVVTDQGMRYAVPDDDALAALGYADVTPVRLSEDLLDLIPAGPVLDRTAAGRYAPGPSPSPSPS